MLLLLMIMGHLVDVFILDCNAVKIVLGCFIASQGISMLENWSSCSKNPIARLLQRILVSKVSRYFDLTPEEVEEALKSKDDETSPK